MGYTRRQFVEAAFEEIGFASYVYDLEPEQLEAAGRRLDTMMAEWNAKGIRLGYPLPSSPERNDLDTETNVPDAAYDGILCGLAVRIAPGLGKTPSPDTKARAKAGYNLMLSRAAMPPAVQLPASMPVGAGAKRVDAPFVAQPANRLSAGAGDILEF